MIAADKRSNVIRKLDEIVINRIAAGEGNHGCIFTYHAYIHTLYDVFNLQWCNGIVNDD
jgi:hypothetical protein